MSETKKYYLLLCKLLKESGIQQIICPVTNCLVSLEYNESWKEYEIIKIHENDDFITSCLITPRGEYEIEKVRKC